MSNKLFTAEHGLSIDGAVDFLYGASVPGATPDTDAAGVGSLYSETTSGAIWKKVFAGTGTEKWLELITNELPITVVNTTSAILDQVPTADSNYFVWSVSAYLESDNSQRFSCLLTASNNATASGDATDVKYEIHSVLKLGTIPGIKVSVELVGAPGSQNMAVQVVAGAGTTFTVYRILKDYTSSHTIGSVIAAGPTGPQGLQGPTGPAGVVGFTAENVANKGAPNGYASLVGGTVPPSQLPSYVDDVLEFANLAAFPATGETGKIYVALDSNLTYRWSGSAYVAIASSARSVTLSGDVSGTANFNASGDATITTTLNGDKVSAQGNVSGAVAYNFTNGSYVAMTITGATTLTITGVPNDGKAYGLTLELTNAGTNVTWPASVTWLGTAPTLRASGVSMVTLVTRNGGTNWYGSAA